MVRERGRLSLVWRLAVPWAVGMVTLLMLSRPLAAGYGGEPQATGQEQGYVTVTSMSPSCGPPAGGTTVFLTGTGFIAGSTSVTFGAAAGLGVLVWSPTMLTVLTPAAVAGTVAVSVTVPNGNAVYPPGFTYAAICPGSTPAITSVSPAKVRARTPTFNLTITGNNFVNGATVTWQGVTKATTFVSSTQVLATIVPSDIPVPGSAVVRVANPDGRTSGAATVTIIPGWQIVGAGDFNHDGRAELVWEGSEGYIALWVMNGFVQTDAVLLYPAPVATDGWHVKAVGDLNADGWPDLVWENTNNGNVAAWYMTGTTQTGVALLATGAMVGGWHVVGAGDLDGDHYAEVIVQNDNGLIGAWFGQGWNPALLNPGPVATGGYTIVGAADVNADGKDDLIWQMPNGGVAVWLMNGASQSGVFVAIAGPVNAARVAAIGKLDADAVPDVAIEGDNGVVLAALMNPNFVGIKQAAVFTPPVVYSTAGQD